MSKFAVLTIEEKQDLLLDWFVNSRNSLPYGTLGEVVAFIDNYCDGAYSRDNLMGNLTVFVSPWLDSLEVDGYISKVIVEVLQDIPVVTYGKETRYYLSAKGIIFFAAGGYIAKKKKEISEERLNDEIRQLQISTGKMQETMLAANIIIAIGTGVAALYYLTESSLLRAAINWHTDCYTALILLFCGMCIGAIGIPITIVVCRNILRELLKGKSR
jgi:hypothetical protein